MTGFFETYINNFIFSADMFVKSNYLFDYCVDLIIIFFLMNFFKIILITIKVELLSFTHRFNQKNVFFFKSVNKKPLISIFSIIFFTVSVKKINSLLISFSIFKRYLKL